MARRNLPNQRYSPIRSKQAVQDSTIGTDLSAIESELENLDLRVDATEIELVSIDGRVTDLEAAPPDYTTSNFNTDFALKTTTDLTEGTNLYYTDTRANSAIDARVTEAYVEALGIDVPIADVTGLSTALAGKANLTGATFSGNVFSTDGAGLSGLSSNGDVYAYRSGGNTGYIFFGNTFTRYMGYDGANYVLNNAGLNGGGPYRNLVTGIEVGGNAFVAGALGFTNANWGFLYRPPTAGGTGAHGWTNAAGTELMRLTEGGQLSLSGAVAPLRFTNWSFGSTVYIHGQDGGGDDLMWFTRQAASQYTLNIKTINMDSKRVTRVNSGTSANSGLISFGTGAPGSLADGEIYFRHS